MAGKFTAAEWATIGAALDADPARYGWPERRDGSLILSSFNIRKLGDVAKKTDGSFALIARYIAQCDLVAVQEVLEDLAALKHVVALVSAEAGEPFGFVVSDITGGRGATGSSVERLAYVYRESRVTLGNVTADLSFDRGYILDELYEKRDEFIAAAVEYTNELSAKRAIYDAKVAAALAAGKKKPRFTKPVFVAPAFLDFIRTPHIASFELGGGANPYRIMAVNAHLLYGNKSKQAIERKREFDKLLEWLLIRAAKHKSEFQDFVLMGDLNLSFDKPKVQRPAIHEQIKQLNTKLKKSRAATVVNFPFIDERKSPRTSEVGVIRTNARLSETFDQIGIFAHDKRLPSFEENEDVAEAGRSPDAFDYQVFDFTTLFGEALVSQDFWDQPKAVRKAFINRFHHDFSDHMPIWVRLPNPV